jgi:uncharacterized protein (TIGR03435 family)
MLPAAGTASAKVLAAGLLFYAASRLSAQPATPKFEIASVRRAAPPQAGAGVRDAVRGGPGTPDPSRVAYTNLRLKDLLLTAYGLKGYQIAGPDWLDTERYDVIANIPPGATKEQFPLMLQDLLLERFKISFHHETKDLPLYELVVAKNGRKLKAWQEPANAPPVPQQAAGAPPPIGKDGFPVMQAGHSGATTVNGRVRIAGSKLPISRLAEILANQLGRPVLDQTGLTGPYDFTLQFSPEGLAGGTPAITPASNTELDEQDAPSLFTAVQEQLGLRLQQNKGLVDVLVIDHVEKTPTEN